ncbi:MAG: hypothetical protein WCW33_06185 [Candidatus Babeliales bacterium]|jgi:hypothetical protein
MKALLAKCTGGWLVGALMITCCWHETASPASVQMGKEETARRLKEYRESIKRQEQAKAVYDADVQKYAAMYKNVQNTLAALEARVVKIEAAKDAPQTVLQLAIDPSTTLQTKAAGNTLDELAQATVPQTVIDHYNTQFTTLMNRIDIACAAAEKAVEADEATLARPRTATTRLPIVVPTVAASTTTEPQQPSASTLKRKSSVNSSGSQPVAKIDLDEKSILHMTAACFEKGLAEKTQVKRISDVRAALLIHENDPDNGDFVQRIHKEIDAAQQVQKLLRIYINFGLTEYMKKTDESGRYAPEIEMELKTNFLDLVDQIIKEKLAIQMSENLNDLLARAIDVYESKEITYAMDIEHRIKSILQLLKALDITINLELQKRFTNARFYRLIARCFVELKEKDLELLKLYTDQSVKDRILQENSEYGRTRAKAILEKSLEQLDDPQQKNDFKEQFNKAQGIDTRIKEASTSGFTGKVKKKLANDIGELPSPIKEVFLEKFKEAQQQAGVIATIKMFISQGSKEDAQSQLAMVKDPVIKAKLDAQIKQMKPKTASTK